MAVGAAEIQLTVTERIPIGQGLARYYGVCQGGTGYATGGATLGEEAANSRYPMPSRFKELSISAVGLASRYVPGTNKCQLLAETTVATSTETPLSELKNAATMATAIPAGTPFAAVGPQ